MIVFLVIKIVLILDKIKKNIFSYERIPEMLSLLLDLNNGDPFILKKAFDIVKNMIQSLITESLGKLLDEEEL